MPQKTATMIPRDPRFEECHKSILGTTGSGKTWWAMFHDFMSPPRNFHKYSHMVSIKENRVYFDTMGAIHEANYQKALARYAKAYPKSVGVCSTEDVFIEMWDANIKFIVFTPEGDEPVSRYKGKVDKLVSLIRRHQVTQTTRTRTPVYLWFDEVSNLAPKHKESQVSFVFTRGRQVGIWGTAISQQPRLVARYIYDESRFKIFFGLSKEHWTSLRKNLSIDPGEEIMDNLWKTPYLLYVYDGYSWERGRVIKD